MRKTAFALAVLIALIGVSPASARQKTPTCIHYHTTALQRTGYHAKHNDHKCKVVTLWYIPRRMGW